MTEPPRPTNHVEPVDTVDEPHEPVVDTASTVRLWRHVLAGPTLWIVHFAVVYLVSEAACEADRTGRIDFLGPSDTVDFVVVATIAGAVAAGLAATLTWRAARRPGASRLLWVGTLLSIGSAAAIVAVGLPVVWLDPC